MAGTYESPIFCNFWVGIHDFTEQDVGQGGHFLGKQNHTKHF
jgi:hypothetical protein